MFFPSGLKLILLMCTVSFVLFAACSNNPGNVAIDGDDTEADDDTVVTDGDDTEADNDTVVTDGDDTEADDDTVVTDGDDTEADDDITETDNESGATLPPPIVGFGAGMTTMHDEKYRLQIQFGPGWIGTPVSSSNERFKLQSTISSPSHKGH